MTTVSVPLRPAAELPSVPKTSLGGATISTRLPTFLPGNWVRRAGKSASWLRSMPTGVLVSQVLSTVLPEVPLTMSALTDAMSSLVTAAPSPSLSTLETEAVALRGFLEMATVGAAAGSDPSILTASRTEPDAVDEAQPVMLRDAATTSAARTGRRGARTERTFSQGA